MLQLFSSELHKPEFPVCDNKDSTTRIAEKRFYRIFSHPLFLGNGESGTSVCSIKQWLFILCVHITFHNVGLLEEFAWYLFLNKDKGYVLEYVRLPVALFGRGQFFILRANVPPSCCPTLMPFPAPKFHRSVATLLHSQGHIQFSCRYFVVIPSLACTIEHILAAVKRIITVRRKAGSCFAL